MMKMGEQKGRDPRFVARTGPRRLSKSETASQHSFRWLGRCTSKRGKWEGEEQATRTRRTRAPASELSGPLPVWLVLTDSVHIGSISSDPAQSSGGRDKRVGTRAPESSRSSQDSPSACIDMYALRIVCLFLLDA